MTTGLFTAVLADSSSFQIYGLGPDQASQRANAIATISELWPAVTLLRLHSTGDW